MVNQFSGHVTLKELDALNGHFIPSTHPINVDTYASSVASMSFLPSHLADSRFDFRPLSFDL
jgi:hypothetical protein